MGARFLYKGAVASGNWHPVDAAVPETQRLWSGQNAVVTADIRVHRTTNVTSLRSEIVSRPGPRGEIVSRPGPSWTTTHQVVVFRPALTQSSTALLEKHFPVS